MKWRGLNSCQRDAYSNPHPRSNQSHAAGIGIGIGQPVKVSVSALSGIVRTLNMTNENKVEIISTFA
jgi:hypothetical protein